MTAEVIDEEGWFHTGDIGTFEDGKYLKITDRKKEMFKLSGGKYIAPQMIENKLKASELIEQAMVIGANEKFASALISPNFVLLHDWCAENHIHFKNNKELVRIPEVIAKIQKEVQQINKTLGITRGDQAVQTGECRMESGHRGAVSHFEASPQCGGR